MKIKKEHVLILLLFVIPFSLVIVSCKGSEDNENPITKLKDLCIRQCVLETGDSSICDTKCGCASEKLSKELSSDDIESLLGFLSNKDEGLQMSEAGIKYKNAFSDCNSGEK